jgi:hypothetical protein
MIRATLALAACLIALGASSAQALVLQQVGPEFDQPTYVTSDPGDAGRLLVVERQGTVRLVENGKVSLFTDISSVVSCCSGERGLLSIALAPDFDSSGRFYLDYTGKEVPGEIHVGEMTATGPAHKSAEASTLRPLLTIPHPVEANHNGGQLQFGPEGDLFISTGDGGGGDDQFHNAQDLSKPLGKILRIQPDPAGAPPYYTVPGDNPFVSVGGAYGPIWSYGLRNPYRFSFDRLSGAIAIGDVGQSGAEEIDFGPAPSRGAGANYGWNCREGLEAGPGDDPGCAGASPSSFVDPVFAYPHKPDPDVGGSSRCAIIGGYVARDPDLGTLFGHYLYTDLCSGAIRTLQLPSQAGGTASDDCYTGLSTANPVSFGEDAAAHLYVVTEPGRVYRISGTPAADCPAPILGPPIPGANSFIGIRAQRRRVERGKTAILTVFVSPCGGRKGESVRLLRNGHPNGTKYLDRACTARFLPRVRRGTSFVATIGEAAGYPAGRSRTLRVKIAPRRRHHHRGPARRVRWP